MKKQPTITYIKDGKEKTIKLNFFSKTFVINQLLHYNPEICYYKKMFINEGVEYIHFKDITFDFNNFINLNQNDGICIFENCTFESFNNYDTIAFYDGTYQFINPRFVNIQNIKAKYAKNFHLVQTDELLNKNIFMSLDLMSESIALEGEFNLGNIHLVGKNIKLGSIDTPIKITLFYYGENNSKIGHESRKNTIELNNCTIENLDERINLVLDYNNLIIDQSSLIDSYGNVILNDSKIYGNPQKDRIIDETVIERQAIISNLKAYKDKIISNITSRSKEITKSKLQGLNDEIDSKTDELIQLEKRIEEKSREVEKIKEDYNNEYEEKNNKIVKSLTKKPINYFDKL